MGRNSDVNPTNRQRSPRLHARRQAARRRPMKRSQHVARQIVQDIVDQDLGPGEKLPLEADLLVQYGVSRASLREALRLLEVQGLITIRPGPGFGTEVGRIDPANLAETLGLYLLLGRSSLDELLDAWLMVEPLLAQLAARNPDRERVKALMAPFDDAAHPDERELSTGLAFHDTIADLADNQLLSLMFGAVGFLVTERVRLSAPDFTLSEATVDAHADIARRVARGDESGAHRAMRKHLEEVIEEIRALPLDIRALSAHR